MKNIPESGGICQSVQGRDKGRYYVIKEVFADGTLSVTDGEFKKLAAPKRKNIKHVKVLPCKAESIAEKFALGKQVFDTEVYSALKKFKSENSL